MTGPGEGETREREIGFWTSLALVVGNMIGIGVFLLPASLAAYGPISIAGWALTGIGAVLLAIVFAGLAAAVPAEGGPYAYTRMGLGEFPGFLVAWGYWMSVWVGNAAIAVGLVGYLTPFFPALADPALAAGAATLAIWLITAVNLLGVREAGMVQVVTTVLKVIPLVAVGTVGLLYVDPANLRPLNVSGDSAISAVTAAAALTLWALLGLECATIPSGSVKDPARTIPRATVIGTGATAVFYLLSTVAVMGVIPAGALAVSEAPYAEAATFMWGGWAGAMVAVAAAVAGIGVLNGWVLVSGQIPYAAARDGVFPARFGSRSRRDVPAFALILSSALTTVLVATNFTRGLIGLFTFAVLLATVTALVPYAFTALAQLVLFVTEPHRFRPQRPVAASCVALLAFAYSVWAIAGTGQETVYLGFLLLLAGGPVYAWTVWRRHAGGSSHE